jgi:hypothetical protein
MPRTTLYYHQRAAQILGRIRYATLATVTAQGNPWNSPVFALHDDRLAVFWVSDKEGQHSRNVRHNGEVFIVFYDSTVPEGEGEGVYFQAKAYELTDAEEIRRVRRLRKGPAGDDPIPFMGDGVRRVYKAVPYAAWINDAQIEKGVFIRDYRVPLRLDMLRKIINPSDLFNIQDEVIV